MPKILPAHFAGNGATPSKADEWRVRRLARSLERYADGNLAEDIVPLLPIEIRIVARIITGERVLMARGGPR